MFVVAYGKYLPKAAQQVYSTTQRKRDLRGLSYSKERISWSRFRGNRIRYGPRSITNFTTLLQTGFQLMNIRFPRNKQDRDEQRYDIFILRECSYNELKLF